MLDTMGMAGFAERAQRELLASGEASRERAVQRARPRPREISETLTAQEAQVARLAREGLSNPEIGARLCISSCTVQYHLGKVFTKLGISSRGQLHRVMSGNSDNLPQR
jgi:DNA-binding NarL/FixJ family response regulator